MVDLDKLSIDKLHGILIACEMRTKTELSKRETAFKASKKGKQKQQVSSDSSNDDSDSEEALFMKRVKKEFSKQKKKMPLKCFNCGKVGHFAAKCPYENNEDSSYEKKPSLIKRSSEERTRKHGNPKRDHIQKRKVIHLKEMMKNLKMKRFCLWL